MCAKILSIFCFLFKKHFSTVYSISKYWKYSYACNLCVCVIGSMRGKFCSVCLILAKVRVLSEWWSTRFGEICRHTQMFYKGKTDWLQENLKKDMVIREVILFRAMANELVPVGELSPQNILMYTTIQF